MTVTENATPSTVQSSVPSTVQHTVPNAGPDIGTDSVPPLVTPAPGMVPVPSTDGVTAPDDALIGDFRAGIDALDAQIIALVQERMALSATAQQARRGPGPGSRRISLSREMEILTHYRDALGRPGTTLAMTLLELCRGPRGEAGNPSSPCSP